MKTVVVISSLSLRRLISFLYASVLLSALLLALARVAHAETVTVGCTGGTGTYGTIQAALDFLKGRPPEPHTINVSGTCTENLYLYGWQRLTIKGSGTGATIQNTDISPQQHIVILFDSSRAITLQSLTVSGGKLGMLLDRASEVTVRDCIIQGNGSGIVLFENSSVFIESSEILNNSGNGIGLDERSVAIVSARIDGNGGSGISITNGAYAIVQGTIRNNGMGVSVTNGSVARLLGTQIEDNGSFGVFIRVSSVDFQKSGRIANHSSQGVRIVSNGTAEFSGFTITNNGSDAGGYGIYVGGGSARLFGDTQVTGNLGIGIYAEQNGSLTIGSSSVLDNTGDGISVTRLSSLQVLPQTTITGNGGAPISCDKTALVFGDLTGLKGIKCSQVEK